mmetsp:Transcript_20439/g.46421  ORF Transcript_20439/g.46421 Transcript_20439/m.46421 type:complete len:229 (-) Transcript_20439:90-776(-)
MLDTTILKRFDLGHFGSAQDTEMFRFFTAVHYQGYPAEGPKHHEHASRCGICFEGGSGRYARPRFAVAVRTLGHLHGKPRKHRIGVLVGRFGRIGGGNRTITRSRGWNGDLRKGRRVLGHQGCDGKVCCFIRYLRVRGLGGTCLVFFSKDSHCFACLVACFFLLFAGAMFSRVILIGCDAIGALCWNQESGFDRCLRFDTLGWRILYVTKPCLLYRCSLFDKNTCSRN